MRGQACPECRATTSKIELREELLDIRQDIRTKMKFRQRVRFRHHDGAGLDGLLMVTTLALWAVLTLRQAKQ